jgi:hypothetical protein
MSDEEVPKKRPAEPESAADPPPDPAGRDAPGDELPAHEEAATKPLPAAAAPARPPLWRRIVVIVLIVVATLLAPLVVITTWVNRDIANTDGYVRTVAPLSSNPAVQNALSAALVNGLWTRVNVDQQIAGALPSWAQPFAAPLGDQLKTYANRAAHALVTSDQFSRLWEQANRVGHAKVKAALLGNQGGAVTTTNGVVSLDLSPVAERLKSALDNRGVHVLDSVVTPGGGPSFVLFKSATLAKIQKIVNFLHKVFIALPLLLIAAWAGAIAVSTRRRRTVLQLGFALAVAMVVTLVAFQLARGAYLNAVSSPQLPRDAATAIFDQLLGGLKAGARTVFVIGIVVWLGALIMGPARWAVAVRGAFSRMFRSAGTRAEATGLDLGPVGGWVGDHRRVLQLAGVVIAIVVLMFWGTPGVAGVIWTVVVLLVYLAVVEFVGWLTPPRAVDSTGERAA